MKLYELKSESRPYPNEQSVVRSTEYMASLAEVKKRFNELKKEKGMSSLQASEVHVQSKLTKEDWVMLLQSDAAGTYCELTPVDFIYSRNPLKEWSKSDD
jgi:hypothetical protein